MSDNPYAAPETMTMTPEKRAIWTKELKSARVILIILAILQLCVGTYNLVQLKPQLEAAQRASVAKMGPDYYFDQSEFDKAFEEKKVMLYGLNSIPAAAGVFFLIMATIVFRYPIAVTLSSLIVYIAAHIAFGIEDPTNLRKGIFLKILVIAVLWKAFQSARTAKAALGNAQPIM